MLSSSQHRKSPASSPVAISADGDAQHLAMPNADARGLYIMLVDSRVGALGGARSVGVRPSRGRGANLFIWTTFLVLPTSSVGPWFVSHRLVPDYLRLGRRSRGHSRRRCRCRTCRCLRMWTQDQQPFLYTPALLEALAHGSTSTEPPNAARERRSRVCYGSPHESRHNKGF